MLGKVEVFAHGAWPCRTVTIHGLSTCRGSSDAVIEISCGPVAARLTTVGHSGPQHKAELCGGSRKRQDAHRRCYLGKASLDGIGRDELGGDSARYCDEHRAALWCPPRHRWGSERSRPCWRGARWRGARWRDARISVRKRRVPKRTRVDLHPSHDLCAQLSRFACSLRGPLVKSSENCTRMLLSFGSASCSSCKGPWLSQGGSS
ncbi:hypothetical protein L1887_54138 [Cichorium endivia]|nr:hypothetical protein L1887_54138 [Cichorium endivia]